MKTILFYIRFALYLIFTGHKRLKLNYLRKHKSKSEADQYLYKIVSNWAKDMLKIGGLNIEVIGRENIPNEACLFVANHQGNFDIPLVLASVGKLTGAIAKKELESVPIVSYWMKQIKCVFMDRENPRAALKSILEGADNLKNGQSMLVFPEGTRSKSAVLGEFKKGSMKLAIKANAPVVPITINGTYKALEGNDGKLKKCDAKITIHEPIYTENLSKEEKAELGDVVREIISDNLKKQNLLRA